MENNKKYKILFIMPSMFPGGAERVLINLLGLFDQNKYEIDLIAVEQKGQLWDSVPDFVNKSLLFPKTILSKLAIYLFRTYNIDWLFRLYGRKIKGDYGTAICFLDSVYSEFLFHNKANIGERIVVIHSSYKTYKNKSKFIKGRYKEVMKKRYSKINKIVTVSNESLEQFKEFFGEYQDMRVIYNPINNANIEEKAKDEMPLELKEDTFNFIAVGSLLPVKGFDLLIEASYMLSKKTEKFKVFILGEGYLREELQKKIDEYKLNNTVFLKGFTSNPYVWMKHADALIMTSKAEGLPTVLCESMILGLPSIVPNVPGCREVVDHGVYGGMFERNTEDLVNIMLQFMEDKDIYQNYLDKCKERAKIFNDERVIENYYHLIHNKNEQKKV